MLSEEKIKKMIRLSDYESGVGESDLRRTRYKKKDYVRLQSLRTVAGYIAATILILLLVLMYFLDKIPWKTIVAEGLFSITSLLIFAGCFAGWLILMSVFVIASGHRSRRKYDESSLRVDEYEQTLAELLQLYEAERKEESA
ncbi:MAG: hypothetical protein J5819_01940 [Eubacterium sp.]|nr:hypothetical protein [Eubacterium sp.]